MKKKAVSILLVLTLAGILFPARAQRAIDETQQWLGLSMVNALDTCFLIKSDVQLRWNADFKEWKTLACRSGLYYYFSTQSPLWLAGGPSLFLSSPNGEFEWNNEYRLWEEIGKEWNFRRIKILFKYRQEQRWMMSSNNQYTFFHRFRFRNELFFKIPTPFNPDALATVFLWNEWFVHQQKQYGFFNDQYRIYTGAQWRFAGFITAQLQYIYFPIVRKDEGNYNNRQAIRLSLNFDFK